MVTTSQSATRYATPEDVADLMLMDRFPSRTSSLSLTGVTAQVATPMPSADGSVTTVTFDSIAGGEEFKTGNYVRFADVASFHEITMRTDMLLVFDPPLASAPAAMALITEYESDALPPYREQVQKLILRHESEVDHIARRSWKKNRVEREPHDFNYAGIRLDHSPLIIDDANPVQMDLWDGTGFRRLMGGTEESGRTQEFFVVPQLSMIYFTRFFVPVFVPPTAEAPAMPLVFLYSWKYPIRVSYTWGYPEGDDHPDFGLVKTVVIKMTAIDIMANIDRTVHLKTGTDRLVIKDMVEGWRKEVEDGLQTLTTGFTVF